MLSGAWIAVAGEGPQGGERVERIASWLTREPMPATPPLEDRAAWEAFGKRVGPAFLAEADKFLPEEPPALPDELYLSREGTMREYNVPYGQRRSRLTLFVLAEGITNEGKYLKAAERELRAILSERTWSMPPHDIDLRKFRGELEDVDLGVAMRAACVATAVSILKDRLPTDLKEEAWGQLRRRAIAPYQKMIRGQDGSLCTWARKTNNWNAVCHAGVIIAGLESMPDVRERAELLAGAEKYLEYYWKGFTEDGYCSEGIGYWNYGFGHFVLAAEAVLRATGGHVDWYEGGKVGAAALFPEKMEMAPGVFPSIGDCVLKPQPTPWIRAVSRQRLFSGPDETVVVPVKFTSSKVMLLYDLACTGFPLFRQLGKDASVTTKPDPLRGWFPDAGVLVARPAGGDRSSLSVTLKGGHNGEHHNHNDVGGFTVGVDGRLPLLDPGIDVYNRDTFGSKRYENEMLNSRGHAVPVVAGQPQKSGAKAASRILKAEFTPQADTFILDLSAVYDVPDLQRLEREFIYSRDGKASLSIIDHFSFAQPETFESTLVTYGEFTRESADTLVISIGDGSEGRVRVKLDTGGLPFEVREEAVKAVKKDAPRRISVALTGKVARGRVSLIVTPAGKDEP